jgi:hypothetical protein
MKKKFWKGINLVCVILILGLTLPMSKDHPYIAIGFAGSVGIIGIVAGEYSR